MISFLADVNIGQQLKIKGGTPISSTYKQINTYISQILPNIFVVAGLILLVLFIAGGLGTILSAGNPEAQQKSKTAVTSAVIGFTIIFASFWIIQIIQVITGIPIFNPPF
jgi:hypothetical protein